MISSGQGAGCARNVQWKILHGQIAGQPVPHIVGRHDVEQDQLLDPAGMVEREPVGDAPAPVMAAQKEALLPSWSAISMMSCAMARLE